MLVTRLPDYPREERRTVKTGQGDIYRDSRHIHTDEKARWSWFLDIGTGDVIVNTEIHGGYSNYEQLREEFPFPEDVYLR